MLTSRNKITILLTATIDTKDVVFVKRSNPLVRESDYINSIKKWIKNTTYLIVFCENSGYPIDKIKSIVEQYGRNQIELLQFNGQNFPGEFGKGYGELLIIKYAIQNSNLIQNSDYVIKVTGRYFIKNIKKIADVLLKNDNIYVMADLQRNLTWADTRIFAFKPSFFTNYLSKYQDMINDSQGFYLEHALARAILCAISDGHKWIPLPSKPLIIGHSGTANTPYKASKIRWLISELLHSVKNYLLKR